MWWRSSRWMDSTEYPHASHLTRLLLRHQASATFSSWIFSPPTLPLCMFFIMPGVCLEEPFDLSGDLWSSAWHGDFVVKVHLQCKDPDHRPVSDCLTNKQQGGENPQSQSQLLLGSCDTWSPVEACANLGRGQKNISIAQTAMLKKKKPAQ